MISTPAWNIRMRSRLEDCRTSKLDIIRLLERPILPLLHGQKLIYTHPGTSFHILLNASLVLGIILASPVVVGQLWGFLAPALYAHEKRVVVPVLVSMVALIALDPIQDPGETIGIQSFLILARPFPLCSNSV